MLRRAALAIALASSAARAGESPSRALEEIREEIARLRAEASRLEGRERGLIGEIARMDGAVALRRAELEEATIRLGSIEEALAERTRTLEGLQAEQARRAPRLARSLRALYTRGTIGWLASLLDAAQGAGRRDGIRYAGFLARGDARRIARWRETTQRLAAERTTLDAEREALSAMRAETARAAGALDVSRRERASAVARIRDDRAQHERAIGELEASAAELSRVTAADAAGPGPAPASDVRAFRGVLDWPAEGRVSASFGPVVHPRFKTRVPHPGWDIDAPEGSPFRSVFDGRVAYAAVLHGYGLTVVVDHGQGVASVYAHAGVLLVGVGDAIARGQELGRVGDSGSLRGPYLYFEIRESGKPADPARWLRSR